MIVVSKLGDGVPERPDVHSRLNRGRKGEPLGCCKWDPSEGKVTPGRVLDDVVQGEGIVDVGSALPAHHITLARLQRLPDTMPCGHEKTIGDQESSATDERRRGAEASSMTAMARISSEGVTPVPPRHHLSNCAHKYFSAGWPISLRPARPFGRFRPTSEHRGRLSSSSASGSGRRRRSPPMPSRGRRRPLAFRVLARGRLRVPRPADERVVRHMLDDLREGMAAISRGIFHLGTDLGERAPLPGHGCRREMPVGIPGHAARIEVRHLMTRRAAHRRDAEPVGSALDGRLMRIAIPLRRPIAHRVAVRDSAGAVTPCPPR